MRDVLRKSYRIPAEHQAFDGHFPHSPIFPAVAQIDLVFDLLRQHFGQPVQSRTIKRAKFRALLQPNTDVELEITLKEAGEARWALTGQGQIYSAGDVIYSLPR